MAGKPAAASSTKVSAIREVFETAGGSLRDYPSQNGYPLTPLQITRLRRLWEAYTDAFNDLHSIQFRYCAAFVRDYMRCKELKMIPPPEGINAILDNIYVFATSSPKAVPAKEQKNVRVPFMALLRGIFPYALQPLGYDEMELAELEWSFRGALDEVPTLNQKQPLFSFMKKQSVVVESCSILSVHPKQGVPIAAAVQWWSMGGKGKTRPWTALRMTEKQFVDEVTATFDTRGSGSISFCDFWVLHNRLFPAKKYVKEKKVAKALPPTPATTAAATATAKALAKEDANSNASFSAASSSSAAGAAEPTKPVPEGSSDSSANPAAATVEQASGSPASAALTMRNVNGGSGERSPLPGDPRDADGITEETPSDTGVIGRPRRGSDATDISVHSSISQAAARHHSTSQSKLNASDSDDGERQVANDRDEHGTPQKEEEAAKEGTAQEEQTKAGGAVATQE